MRRTGLMQARTRQEKKAFACVAALSKRTDRPSAWADDIKTCLKSDLKTNI